jgi:hypothetical protein
MGHFQLVLDQTKETLVLEENMKTNPADCFQQNEALLKKLSPKNIILLRQSIL